MNPKMVLYKRSDRPDDDCSDPSRPCVLIHVHGPLRLVVRRLAVGGSVFAGLFPCRSLGGASCASGSSTPAQ